MTKLNNSQIDRLISLLEQEINISKEWMANCENGTWVNMPDEEYVQLRNQINDDQVTIWTLQGMKELYPEQ